MNNATFFFAEPKNEPVYSYAPNSKERELLEKELTEQYNNCIEIPLSGIKWMASVFREFGA